VLSLSTGKIRKHWQPRTHPKYQLAQAEGRDEGLVDYTPRTGQPRRDTDLPEGCMLSEQRLDETVPGAGNTAVLVDTTQAALVPTTRDAVEMASHLGLDLDAAGLTSWDIYVAMLTPGHVLMRTVWHDQAAAAASETSAEFPDDTRLRQIRIIRY
jgi:hypothetical protein